MSQKENEKGVFEMTDGIGRIFGGNSYGVGGYVPQRKEKEEVSQEAQPTLQRETVDVAPEDVLRFLGAKAEVVPQKQVGKELAPEVVSRVAASMEKFNTYMTLIEQEFGKELAPEIFNLAMDNLM